MGVLVVFRKLRSRLNELFSRNSLSPTRWSGSRLLLQSISHALTWPVSWLLNGSPIKPDESVVFFPQSARKGEDGRWVVPVHLWVVELERGTLLRKLGMRAILEMMDLAGVAKEQNESDVFNDRLAWFVADREINKRINVSLQGQEFVSPRTKRSGHSKFEVHLDAANKPGSVLQFGINGNPQLLVEATVQLVPKRGLSIISDIDDTIKISNVFDREQLVKGLFFDEYKIAPGMPELYGSLQSRGACFHYVSSSPWQLYPSIKPLLDTFYPPGSLTQRHFFVGDRSLVDFFHSSMEYKKKSIQKLLDQFSERYFLLIGDSGEKDPEVYCQIAQSHPDRISAILIRDVSVETKLEVKRWRVLQEQVPDVPILLFDEPLAIKQELEKFEKFDEMKPENVRLAIKKAAVKTQSNLS